MEDKLDPKPTFLFIEKQSESRILTQILQFTNPIINLPRKRIIKQMQPLHRLPITSMTSQHFPRQPPIVSIVGVSLGIESVDETAVAPLALVVVLILHGNIEELKFGSVVHFSGHGAAESVAL